MGYYKGKGSDRGIYSEVAVWTRGCETTPASLDKCPACGAAKVPGRSITSRAEPRVWQRVLVQAADPELHGLLVGIVRA
jgi:hypothetical protein